jgi:hypothetical protein
MGDYSAFAGLIISGFFLLLLLVILWILLPFAVFGTKDKLNQLIAEGRTTNQTLREMAQDMKSLRSALAGHKPSDASDVVLENKPPQEADARAQKRTEDLLRSKGFLRLVTRPSKPRSSPPSRARRPRP